MNIRRSIILTLTILGTIIGVLFLAWKPSPASGQQNFPDSTRKTACGCYCGGPTPGYFVFKEKDCAGILAADACGSSFGNVPAAQLASMCKTAAQNRSPGSCPILDKLCGSTNSRPDQACENIGTPWFDRSVPCPDVQAPQIDIVGSEVRLSFCGVPIYRWDSKNKDPLLREAYKIALMERVTQTAGSKICCTSFRRSMQTGRPCNPAEDLDCDGKPNQTDVNTTRKDETPYPAIDLYTTAAGAKVDEFPFGMNPDDPDFMPQRTARDSKGVGDCPCKWELISGNLACSPDGRQNHVYTATWKCPTTGKEVFTTKYAKASEPCKKSKRTGMFEYFYPRPVEFLEFMLTSQRSVGCGLS
jgi:hypothetical protein